MWCLVKPIYSLINTIHEIDWDRPRSHFIRDQLSAFIFHTTIYQHQNTTSPHQSPSICCSQWHTVPFHVWMMLVYSLKATHTVVVDVVHFSAITWVWLAGLLPLNTRLSAVSIVQMYVRLTTQRIDNCSIWSQTKIILFWYLLTPLGSKNGLNFKWKKRSWSQAVLLGYCLQECFLWWVVVVVAALDMMIMLV